MRMPQPYRRVKIAINAIGPNGRFYTFMMLADGRIVARRSGFKEGTTPYELMKIRRHTPAIFRDEETLMHVAWMNGYEPCLLRYGNAALRNGWNVVPKRSDTTFRSDASAG